MYFTQIVCVCVSVCVCVCVCTYMLEFSHLGLRPHRLQPTRLFWSRELPGKNTGVNCHFILQGIFLIQGMYSCLLHLLHCRWILSH